MESRLFIPGAELSAAFYTEVVRPLLDGQSHAAALLGYGSEVLGYDTARSTDHGWGPSLTLFLDDVDAIGELRAILDVQLPERFRGWPVRFGWDMVEHTHHVSVTTLSGWMSGYLGVDPIAGMSTLDWLLTPQQRILGVVAGAVHADDTGVLGEVRRSLTWYPDQVWRWILASQWHKLAQEEALVARAAEVGDDLGSRVVAGRVVRGLVRLSLLMQRHYAPYQKWLGTAFMRQRHSDDLPRHLTEALRAHAVVDRESALASAYTALARRHNALGLTDSLDPTTGPYHKRPARVLMADRFATACLANIDDPELRALPPIGAIDQIVDNTDVLESPRLYRRLSNLYDENWL